MIGWHTKRTLSTEHITFKISYIFFIFSYDTLKLQVIFNITHIVRMIAKCENFLTKMYKLSIIEDSRTQMINGSIFLSVYIRNFKVRVNTNKVKKRYPREVFSFFWKTIAVNKVWWQILFRSDVVLHTHCYSPCRFSDIDLFSIPGRWSLYPRLIKI